ncbi:hypothetical protein [Phaeacidiphilus oryzae]|uniref:hypothetical protein n=1 Tax=Phaeacidiphilus oryzae TaxID=348818 RepID=UPI000569CE86|nr:hypothetical protein [Phaeacidiphilus oryzae]
MVDLLRDRLLTMTRAGSAVDVLQNINPDRGGLVLVGKGASERLRPLRGSPGADVLAIDPERHTGQWATPEDPFGLADGDGRLTPGPTLTQVLKSQLASGASFAVTPTGFIPDRDVPTLDAVVDHAAEAEVANTLVVLPCGFDWLREPHIHALVSAAGRSRYPVGLALAGDAKPDPLDHSGVPAQMRRLCQTCDRLVIWRTDLAALDAIAHGALAGAVGTNATLRHAMRPMPERKGFGRRLFPALIVERLLRFVRQNTIRDWYAAGRDAWTCDCTACDGRRLTDIPDGAAGERATLGHNCRVLGALHCGLAEHREGEDRLEWWHSRIDEAWAAHRRLAVEVGGDQNLQVPRVLTAWRRDPPPPLSGAWSTAP